jgi:hypothetical protein
MEVHGWRGRGLWRGPPSFAHDHPSTRVPTFQDFITQSWYYNQNRSVSPKNVFSLPSSRLEQAQGERDDVVEQLRLPHLSADICSEFREVQGFRGHLIAKRQTH